MGADQFKMLPSLPYSSSSPAQSMSLLLLPLLVISSTLGCTKWDSCEEKEHYCYQCVPHLWRIHESQVCSWDELHIYGRLPRSMSHSPQPSNLWTVSAEPSNPYAAKASHSGM